MYMVVVQVQPAFGSWDQATVAIHNSSSPLHSEPLLPLASWPTYYAQPGARGPWTPVAGSCSYNGWIYIAHVITWRVLISTYNTIIRMMRAC
jgi:hypothetical protein